MCDHLPHSLWPSAHHAHGPTGATNAHTVAAEPYRYTHAHSDGSTTDRHAYTDAHAKPNAHPYPHAYAHPDGTAGPRRWRSTQSRPERSGAS